METHIYSVSDIHCGEKKNLVINTFKSICCFSLLLKNICKNVFKSEIQIKHY